MKADAFWAKVDKSGDCWLWTGARNQAGYGRCYVDRKDWLAHRWAMVLSGRELGDSLVLHRCDNPPCVRPDHLFIGTGSDNVQDMIEKERGRAQLTLEQVDRIQRRLEKGTITEIAKRFGVSWDVVKNAMVGHSFGTRMQRFVDDEFGVLNDE